jgi:hypothetical protein
MGRVRSLIEAGLPSASADARMAEGAAFDDDSALRLMDRLVMPVPKEM